MIQYISTRGRSEGKTSAQAIIGGIAPDLGLYVPAVIPKLPMSVEEMRGLDYKRIAGSVIRAFFDDYTGDEIEYCVERAYDEKFDSEEIAPLVRAGDAYFLELYHGRTSAFKDMALSVLPYLLTAAVRKEGEEKKICILTATSGDTGKAALEGFADVPGTEIIVFFPEWGVSDTQKRQMVTQEGRNTHVFGINGNFDDAQTGVKKIFADDGIKKALDVIGCRLSSANSINIGRLVPQIAYYVYAYVRMTESGAVEPGQPVNIAVPTGNFGNLLAGYYASLMGIPIYKFICASNENRVLTDFINTGIYDARRDFFVTNSPSMDILVSSNLERLLYILSDGDAGEVLRLMKELDSEGHYEVPQKIKRGLESFHGGYATVDETNKTIGMMYREHSYLIDTHTAVAYKVYEDYRTDTGDMTPVIIASTASPFKFPSSVSNAIGLPDEDDEFACAAALSKASGVRIPAGLKGLDRKKIRHCGVIDPDKMAATVMEVL